MLITSNDLLLTNPLAAISLLEQKPPFSMEELAARKQAIKLLRPLIEPWKRKLQISQYTKTLADIAQAINQPKISSEQAWQLGYICLKEASKTAPVPGQWLLSDDLNTIIKKVFEWQNTKDEKLKALDGKRVSKIEELLKNYLDIAELDRKKIYEQLADVALKNISLELETVIFDQLALIAVAQEKNVVFESKTASYQITLNSQELSPNTKTKTSFMLAITPEIRQNILDKKFDLVQTWLKNQIQNKITQTQNQLVELQREVIQLANLLNIKDKHLLEIKGDNQLRGLLGDLKHKWKMLVYGELFSEGILLEFSKNSSAIVGIKISQKITLADHTFSLKIPFELAKQVRFSQPLYQETPEEYIAKVVTYVKENCLSSVNKELSLLANLVIETPDSEELKPYFNRNNLLSNLGNLFHKVNSSKKAYSIKKLLEQIEELKTKHYQQARVALHAKEAERITKIGSYPEHFQLARSMSRRWTLLVGPTNSGKTFQALNILAEANTGYYLAPLRLLALEGQEELLKRGCLTSFLTGEERDLRPNSSHLASTIEMLDVSQKVDVAVIDEAQMLFDRDRGWAWTTALFGVAAKHLVLTGAPSCIKMVQRIAEHLNEPLEIIHCQRFTEMEVLKRPSKLTELEPATAVIAFSRRDVLGLKSQLEAVGKNVAVIYGNLSPEVRREESRRFRTQEADIVIATDAIGMGLNLPIKTLLFWTTEKWDGQEQRELTSEEIRQIAGRAGRYGMYEKAFIGAFNQRSLKIISESLKMPIPEQVSQCQVMPGIALVEQIANILETNSLSKTLKFFRNKMLVKSPLLCPARMEAVISLAEKADVHPDMSLSERLVFSCTPIDIRDATIVRYWQSWINQYNRDQIIKMISLPRQYTSINSAAQNHNELEEAERLTKVLTCYSWLSYRFEENFPDLEECDKQRQLLNSFIENSLRKRGLRRLCQHCGKALGPLYQYSMCENCYYSRHINYDLEEFY